MKIITLFASLALIAACKTQRVMLSQNGYGCYYALYRYPSTSKDVAVVYGKIRTENADNPAAVLFANRNMHLTDSTGGTYRIMLAPGKYQLSASTLSYNVMRLKSLILKAGDSIRVDFFLTADDSPHG